MKVGDLIYDKVEKRYGMLIQQEWKTSIGTPFDWLALWFDDGTSLWGIDSYCIVLVGDGFNEGDCNVFNR